MIIPSHKSGRSGDMQAAQMRVALSITGFVPQLQVFLPLSGSLRCEKPNSLLHVRAICSLHQYGSLANMVYVIDKGGKIHIPPHFVVERVTAHRKPPEVRICRLRNQSAVGTRPPCTSAPHC